MPSPKQVNPRRERRASAPYNFVPLAEKPVLSGHDNPNRSIYHKDLLTGMIQCTLTARMPLYTRAALEERDYGKKQAKDNDEFFYVDETTKRPVIPGSGIRGVLRTMVEIISFGKLQPVTDRQLFYRSLDTTSAGEKYREAMTGGNPSEMGWHPMARAGYVERKGRQFFIRPALSILGAQHYRVDEEIALKKLPGLGLKAMAEPRAKGWSQNRNYQWKRVKIWFVPTKPEFQEKSACFFAKVTDISHDRPFTNQDWREGRLIASGWVPGPSGSRGKSRHWIIGPADSNAETIPLEEIDIDAYESLGGGLTKQINKAWFSVLPKPDGEPEPCFYIPWTDTEGRQRIAFGHTPMFRLPYTNSPHDLLPQEHKDATTVDLAEAIFGRVGKTGDSIAGRVYVGDAHIVGDSPVRNEPMSLLLSGPKPTSFQHYLVQTTDEKDKLAHYDSGAKTTVRGHKYYWHRGDDALKEGIEKAGESQEESRSLKGDESSQTTNLRVVSRGTVFHFDIRFENLSKVELGALLWALQPQGQKDIKYYHKVGMGKPYGLGSVELTPALLLSERSKRYESLLEDPDWSPTGGLKADDSTAYKNEFEAFILNAIGQGKSEFMHQDRIRTLLAMMQWPGPESEKTRYLEVRRKRKDPPNHHDNEYKDRKVLPGPLLVLNPDLDDDKGSSRKLEVLRAPAKVAWSDDQNRPAPSSRSRPPDVVIKLTSIDDAKVGALVEGVIKAFDVNNALIDLDREIIGTLPYSEMPGKPQDRASAQAKYSIGQVLRLRVKGINKAGKVKLEMRPIDNM